MAFQTRIGVSAAFRERPLSGPTLSNGQLTLCRNFPKAQNHGFPYIATSLWAGRGRQRSLSGRAALDRRASSFRRVLGSRSQGAERPRHSMHSDSLQLGLIDGAALGERLAPTRCSTLNHAGSEDSTHIDVEETVSNLPDQTDPS
jgi:hypothetical protein